MTSQTAQRLDGKALAQKLNSELKERIPSLQAQFGRPPGLAVLMVGEDPANPGGRPNWGCKLGMRSFSSLLSF